MRWWVLLLIGLGVAGLAWGACVATLVLLGRRTEARALARFVPDCLVLFRRLLGDPRVPRARKLLLAGTLAYLALPFDLVPDFLPVVGQLDDVLVVALTLRLVVRSAGEPLAREHWPGPPESLAVLLRLSFGRA